MKYRRSDAKDYARAHMKGIWAAALMPFAEDLSIDEKGFRQQPAALGRRSRHRRRVHRRQAERVLLDVGRRAQALDGDRGRRDRQDAPASIASCSDQNMDTVIELAKHAQAIGAPYIVVHAPVLHFLHKQDETLYQYYKTISEQVDIGIAMWSHRGLRLSDEPGAVRADRRAAEHRRDQIQRAARDVCAADADGRRQDPGQHGVGGGVVRQHRRARLAALSVLVAAVPVPDQGRPPDARLHRSRVQGRGRQGEGRSATASIRCARRSAARGRPRSRRRIRNTGRS